MITLKNQYLREMGVDVWVTRPARQRIADLAPPKPNSGDGPRKVAATAPNRVLPVEEPAPAKRAAILPDPADAFHLCFVTYPGMSLIFSVPVAASALPEAYRRFADDIALAIVRSKEATVTSLRWPMVQSSHIDQSEAAAQVIVDQKLARCGNVVLLFGEVARRYAGQRGVLKLDELEAYFSSLARKRELWQALQPVRRDLAS